MTERLIPALEGAGCVCFVPLDKRSCFDIAAKSGERLLLLKISPNIDSFKDSQAADLKALAAGMAATPLIVGERTKTNPLGNGTVYERYGINALTADTLLAVLGGALPRKRFYKGRMFADIDAAKLEGINAAELARELGITREAVHAYKHGTRPEFEKATRMESVLDKNIIQGIDPFVVPLKAKLPLSGYLKQMSSLGFDVVPVHRGFDALAKAGESLLVDSEPDLARAKRKARGLENTADFFSSHPVLVLNHPCKTVEGVPVLTSEEIREAESTEGLIDLVKKRRKA